jgi:hypothetical protein
MSLQDLQKDLTQLKNQLHEATITADKIQNTIDSHMNQAIKNFLTSHRLLETKISQEASKVSAGEGRVIPESSRPITFFPHPLPQSKQRPVPLNLAKAHPPNPSWPYRPNWYGIQQYGAVVQRTQKRKAATRNSPSKAKKPVQKHNQTSVVSTPLFSSTQAKESPRTTKDAQVATNSKLMDYDPLLDDLDKTELDYNEKDQ